jgi:hypothetical protein
MNYAIMSFSLKICATTLCNYSVFTLNFYTSSVCIFQELQTLVQHHTLTNSTALHHVKVFSFLNKNKLIKTALQFSIFLEKPNKFLVKKSPLNPNKHFHFLVNFFLSNVLRKQRREREEN